MTLSARILLFGVVFAVLGWNANGEEGKSKERLSERESAKQIRALGGHAFLNLKTNRIGEINLNSNEKVNDETMKLVACCKEITDLSLEKTAVGDTGMERLKGLSKIEWLNLYQTEVSDKAIPTLRTLTNLRFLPIGETGITDAGLTKLYALTNLEYLGLRGTAITDEGLAGIAALENLTGLHLGQTKVTDRSLRHIGKLSRLEKLWLHDTPITGTAVAALLSQLGNLKELHLQRTHLTIEEVARLRKDHPRCDIRFEKD